MCDRKSVGAAICGDATGGGWRGSSCLISPHLPHHHAGGGGSFGQIQSRHQTSFIIHIPEASLVSHLHTFSPEFSFVQHRATKLQIETSHLWNSITRIRYQPDNQEADSYLRSVPDSGVKFACYLSTVIAQYCPPHYHKLYLSHTHSN